MNIYVKMLTAPIWGLAFLLFLPAIGFYLTVKALVGYTLQRFGLELAWMPVVVGESHFLGQESSHPGETSIHLDKLDEEILKMRNS
jgi:hypothetical protein